MTTHQSIEQMIEAEGIKNEILQRFKPYLKEGALDFSQNLSAQMDVYAKSKSTAFVRWMIDSRYDYNRATGKSVAAWDNYKEFTFEELYELFKIAVINASHSDITGR